MNQTNLQWALDMSADLNTSLRVLSQLTLAKKCLVDGTLVPSEVRLMKLSLFPNTGLKESVFLSSDFLIENIDSFIEYLTDIVTAQAGALAAHGIEFSTANEFIMEELEIKPDIRGTMGKRRKLKKQ